LDFLGMWGMGRNFGSEGRAYQRRKVSQALRFFHGFNGKIPAESSGAGVAVLGSMAETSSGGMSSCHFPKYPAMEFSKAPFHGLAPFRQLERNRLSFSRMIDLKSALPRAAPGAIIVFVHGAIVNGWEMTPLRRRLKRLGYGVRQFHWPSVRAGLDENVERLGKFIAETDADTVHVVAHSMGGVLTRQLFERGPDPRPGRLVAIGSPLTDCWVGRRYAGLRGPGPWLVGRSVRDYIGKPIDPVWRGTREFGVIAGTYPFGAGSLFRNMPAPSDGVILLEETWLAGITDHATFHLNHFGMLFSRRCTAAVARFLATGKFDGINGISEG
jgi:pimeloyl-ACP methyl ester carboxylesterase